MDKFLWFLAMTAALPALAQQPTDTSASEPFLAVSYVEIVPSARARAVAAFRSYAAVTRALDRAIRFEVFEERSKPGNFSIVETWPTADLFAGEGADARIALLAALEPIRVSNFDQRPYKTMTVDSPDAADARSAIYVISHVDVSPGPEVPALLSRVAEESRGEEGNIRYDVLQHTMRANHFTVIEAWRDIDAYQDHIEAPHTRRYRDELGPFLGSPLDQRLYAAVE